MGWTAPSVKSSWDGLKLLAVSVAWDMASGLWRVVPDETSFSLLHIFD